MRESRRARCGGGDEERIVPGTPLWDRQFEEHEQRYRFVAARVSPGMRVLDAGCGVGYGAALLADSNAGHVTAVDISEDALLIARGRCGRPEAAWLYEDCQGLEEGGRRGPFDLICNLENLEHLGDLEAFLRRVTEILEQGGVLVTSTPNRIGTNHLRGPAPHAPSPNRYHFREYSSAEFRNLLLRYFREVELYFQTLDPIECLDDEASLALLRRNLLDRLARLVRRALGGRGVAATPVDHSQRLRYQILSADPGDERVITQLAVCRGPRTVRT